MVNNLIDFKWLNVFFVNSLSANSKIILIENFKYSLRYLGGKQSTLLLLEHQGLFVPEY